MYSDLPCVSPQEKLTLFPGHRQVAKTKSVIVHSSTHGLPEVLPRGSVQETRILPHGNSSRRLGGTEPYFSESDQIHHLEGLSVYRQKVNICLVTVPIAEKQFIRSLDLIILRTPNEQQSVKIRNMHEQNDASSKIADGPVLNWPKEARPDTHVLRRVQERPVSPAPRCC